MEIYVWILLVLNTVIALFSDEPRKGIMHLILYVPIYGRILGWF